VVVVGVGVCVGVGSVYSEFVVVVGGVEVLDVVVRIGIGIEIRFRSRSIIKISGIKRWRPLNRSITPYTHKTLPMR